MTKEEFRQHWESNKDGGVSPSMISPRVPLRGASHKNPSYVL